MCWQQDVHTLGANVSFCDNGPILYKQLSAVIYYNCLLFGRSIILWKQENQSRGHAARTTKKESLPTPAEDRTLLVESQRLRKWQTKGLIVIDWSETVVDGRNELPQAINRVHCLVVCLALNGRCAIRCSAVNPQDVIAPPRASRSDKWLKDV